MSILPLSQNNALLRDASFSKEIAFPLKEGVSQQDPAAVAGKNDQVHESAKKDEKATAFGKIFNKKKAEREGQDEKKSNTRQISAEVKAPVKNDEKSAAAEKLAKTTTAGKEVKRLQSLKDILSALIEKNRQTVKGSQEPAKKSETAGMKIMGVHPERFITLRERLENARKKESETVTVQTLLRRSGKVKNEKTAVIVDLRDTPAEKTKTAAAVGKPVIKKEIEKNETGSLKRANDSKDQVEVKVYARHPGAADTAESAGRLRPDEVVRVKSDFTARLADAVKSEMVKHSGIILKNGGSGEIHLVLKPESLGSVRVRLNLEDNHIGGRIIVDNNTVKEIIRQHLGDLETALQEKGYESAGLNVFVAGEHKESSDAEKDFEALVAAGEDLGPLLTKEYESGGVTIYDDALVNIVL